MRSPRRPAAPTAPPPTFPTGAQRKSQRKSRCRSRGRARNQPPAVTRRSDAASRRRSAQVALPVTTTENPAGLVADSDRCPRARAVLKVQACPSRAGGGGWTGGSTVPSLVILRTNEAALALLSSSEASVPAGVMKPSAPVTGPAPAAPTGVRLELTGCQGAGRPAGATAGYGASRVRAATSG